MNDELSTQLGVSQRMNDELCTRLEVARKVNDGAEYPTCLLPGPRAQRSRCCMADTLDGGKLSKAIFGGQANRPNRGLIEPMNKPALSGSLTPCGGAADNPGLNHSWYETNADDGCTAPLTPADSLDHKGGLEYTCRRNKSAVSVRQSRGPWMGPHGMRFVMSIIGVEHQTVSHPEVVGDR